MGRVGEREREKCLIFAFYDDPQQMSIDMKFHFTAAARVLVEISPASPSLPRLCLLLPLLQLRPNAIGHCHKKHFVKEFCAV